MNDSASHDARAMSLSPDSPQAVHAAAGRARPRRCAGSSVVFGAACAVTGLGLSGAAPAQQAISAVSDTVATFPAGTIWGGYIALTGDPTGPFFGQGVHFVGNGTELRSAPLIYRFAVDFAQCVQVSSVDVEGAAFWGPGSELRLLDESLHPVASVITWGGNAFTVNTLNVPNVSGRRFYLEEYDTSITWRWRSRITFHTSPSAGCPCLPPVLVTPMPETSAAWAAGTSYNGFVGATGDILAPWTSRSVMYRGFSYPGAGTETLNGGWLVYRYRVSADQPITLNELTVSGAGFNSPGSVVRVLDSARQPLVSVPTYGGNTDQRFSVPLGSLQGATFYVDEFDGSGMYRYRRLLALNGFTPVFDPTPAAAQTCPTQAAMFSVAGAGPGPFTYAWRINDPANPGQWLPITDGPFPGGFVFAGSATATLLVSPATGFTSANSRSFRCAVSSACGSVTTNPATLTICYANCDCSTSPPTLNIADFTCFLQKFASADPYANCDASTTPPTLNIADFTCFLQRFAVGCP